MGLSTAPNRVQIPPSVAIYAALAEKTHKLLYPHLPADEKDGAGGFFALTDSIGLPYFAFRVGWPPEHKIDGRLRRSLEKPLRAARCGHKTSRESRNESKDQWAGALWGGVTKRRGGFSGYPEDFDEILTADVLVRAGDMSVDEALLQLEPNSTFIMLKHLFDWAGPRLV